MTYQVVLEQSNGSYTASVPTLPGVRAAAVTREEVLASVKSQMSRRMTEIEVVDVELDPAKGAVDYLPDERALAEAAARNRGESAASLTGKPWLDFAGYLGHLSDEDWDEYETILKRIREEGNASPTEP